MILLDYASPRPSEPRGASRLTLLRYIAGLSAGIVIGCALERSPGGLICCGVYSILPVAAFSFVNFLRRAHSRIPLEERHALITIFSGRASALIEYGFAKWADIISSDRLFAAAIAAFSCAFVSIRRQAFIA